MEGLCNVSNQELQSTTHNVGKSIQEKGSVKNLGVIMNKSVTFRKPIKSPVPKAHPSLAEFHGKAQGRYRI